MRRAIAFVIYYVGLAHLMFFPLRGALSVADGRNGEDLWVFLFLPLILAAEWLIVARLGSWLGLPPRSFFRSVGKFLFLVEPEEREWSRSD